MRKIIFILLPVWLVACSAGVEKHQVIFTPPAWPQRLKGTTYKPKPETLKRPAVLLIHGGVKLGKDGRWAMSHIARKLSTRGYYVLNITYRSLLEYEYPAQIDDARQAISWLKENAEEERIDPERIAVFGYSAGGYIGSMAALQPVKNKPKIAALIVGAAPADLSVYRSGELLKKYFGATDEPSPTQLKQASPLTHITEKSPPFFFYHGTKDQLVRPHHTEEMVAALDFYKVPLAVSWIHGKGHIGAFFSASKAIDQAVNFLDFYL